jgi:D-alanyl-lipoteichoic acid acyltransferase DltB (MBOAT superfamily)
LLFNSFEYVVFFAITLALYFRLRLKARWPILLIASYIFYMGWQPLFVLLLMFSTLVDYTGGLVIDTATRQSLRKLALCMSVGTNLALLGTFKYYNFFVHNVSTVGHAFGYDLQFVYINVILPVGISFYTFQSLSYTFDVYARKLPAQRNFLRYALYVAFFPQLEAGPIERAARLVPQLQTDKSANPARFRSGLWLIGYGLFKKMCISDIVAPAVQAVYAQPRGFSGSYLLIASFLFAIQIYCDFSGYSDIAIGCARMLGFDLMINFRQPYFSRSLTEFWRRWHISLSTWFRDYLYFPLGGNKGSLLLGLRNVMIVFLLSGVWHGAAWTFIIWGGLHGFVLCIERVGSSTFRYFRPGNPEALSDHPGVLRRIAGLAWTNAIVLAGWVFFRAQSLRDANYILTHFAKLGRVSYSVFKVIGFASFEILLTLFHLAVLFVVDYMILARQETLRKLGTNRVLAIGIAVALFYDIIMFGVFEKKDFIYFQF